MTPRLQDQQDSKSSCIMSFGDSSICWLRLITVATFLVRDDQHRSWRLPFAFLPATDISPPVFFSLTWRESDQGWKTSATPPYSNLIRDVRSRRPDNEVLHIQLHASDLAMLPFHTRLLWLIPLPAEWSWLPAWCPGVHPASYRNSDIWKKHQNEGT